MSGQLSSYTSKPYLGLFGMAVVPRAPVRIEDECRACGQRRISPWADWHCRGDEELEMRCQALENHPKDAAAALTLLDSVQEFYALEDFDCEADDMCQNFLTNAQVLGRLADTFSFFRQFEKADYCFQLAQALQDSLVLQCLRAVHLLRQARPSEAQRWLEPILSGQVQELRWCLYLLVEGYQSRGAHAQAADLLTRIASTWPAQTVEPEHKWYAARAAYHRKGSKHLSSLWLEQARPVVPLIAQPLLWSTVIPLLIIYAGVTLWMGRARSIFLLNGLDAPYEVEIRGVQHRLLPGVPLPLTIAEGTIEYKVVSPHSQVASGSLTLATPWLSRAFESKVFVINPDKVAVLLTERLRYTKHPDSSPYDSEFHVYSGKSLLEFSDIDLFFQDFPKEIEVAESELGHFFDRPNFTRRLAVFSVPVARRFKFIQRYMGLQESKRYIQRGLDQSPSLEALEAARDLMSSRELLELATPYLDESPTRIYWHILYQELGWSGRDLEKEYRQRLARSPQDAELQCLLGRVAYDPQEARRLIGQSAAASPFGLLEQAQDRLCVGDFDGALQLCGPNSAEVPPLLHEVFVAALNALGRYEELLELSSWELNSEQRVPILVSAGHLDEARKFVDGSASEDAPYLGLLLNYAQGKPSSPLDDSDLQLFADLLDGKTQRVVEHLGQTNWHLNLSLYLLASTQKQPAIAADQLKKSIQLLLASPPFRAEARAGRLLQHPGNPQEALNVGLACDQKRIFLAAMALRDPAHRDSYCTLGRKLNFDRTFPYWTLDKIFKGRM